MDSKKQNSSFELVIGNLLLTGVLLSAGFLLAGIIWQWRLSGSPSMHYMLGGTNLFAFWMSNGRLLMEGRIHPQALINMGIGLLLLTPYVRVFASMLYFAFVERNMKYTIFTAFVFSVLSYSLF